MNDLFGPPAKLRGKMRELAAWMRAGSAIKTSDVVDWGQNNFYVSALRSARLLTQRGYLRRMTEEEIKVYYGEELGQGVWVPTEQLRQANLA